MEGGKRVIGEDENLRSGREIDFILELKWGLISDSVREVIILTIRLAVNPPEARYGNE